MNFLTHITRFLRSTEAVMVLLIVTLSAQMPHSATVFHRVATGSENPVIGWAHAYLYAAGVELLIAMCVVRGKIMWSWIFVAASIAMNAIYYGLTPATINPGAIVVSVLLPVGIAFYSHEAAARSGATQPAPVHKPVASAATVQADADAEPQPRKVAKPASKKQTAIPQIINLGLHRQSNAAQAIADRFNVHYTTATRWLQDIRNQEVAA